VSPPPGLLKTKSNSKMINIKKLKVFLKLFLYLVFLWGGQYKIILNSLELKCKENFLVVPIWETGAPFGKLP
jgi:hypothetical protein